MVGIATLPLGVLFALTKAFPNWYTPDSLGRPTWGQEVEPVKWEVQKAPPKLGLGCLEALESEDLFHKSLLKMELRVWG